jgi:2'-5' RNA ligase
VDNPNDASSRMLRLFVALWPDAPTREAVALWQRAWTWPQRAALVPPERLHLTLHFLGNVPARRLPAVREGLQAPFEPFALEFGWPDVWPNGVAVLRPALMPACLLRLHQALARRVADLALPLDDRPFQPHFTLARRAAGAQPPPHGPRLRWEADHGYVLALSLPGGAGYEVIERFG